ncbi:MAG: signal peptidase I [Acidimicrobiia bacterium]
MTNEQRVKTLFTEANPIPDVDSFAVDEIGGTAYLATLEQWRSEMTQLDTRSIEKKKPQRGRLVLVLGAAAAAILVGGVITLTGDQTGDTSSDSAAQPATVASDVIRASEVVLGATPSTMEPTIQADALLTVDRSAYDSNLPERFDIVLYADVYLTSSPELVTRVIGLPGETIEGRDGSLYVNGSLLDEPYLNHPDP